MSTPGSNLAATKTMLAEMVAEAQELKTVAGGSVTDAVAAWLAPQYLLAAREKLSVTDGSGRLEVLRTILHDWTLLRRGDQASARLQLDREELEWQRSNSKAQKEQEFREWLQCPEVRAKYFPKFKAGITKTTMRKIERELALL
jgi:hypothetical protein